MVLSEYKPSINIDEEQIIMEEDKDIEVDIYELDAYHKTIQVVIGKENKRFFHRGLLTYSIYAIVKNRIKSRLGVIEVPIKNYVVYDTVNKTPDFTLYSPLFFSFVDSSFIDKLAPKTFENDDEIIEDKDEIFDINTLKNNKEHDEKEIVSPKGDDDLFVITNFKENKLQEESETTAKNIRKKYVDESGNNWIQKFMKNPNYEIELNTGRGDCFFYVIIQAFNQIGKETTVSKLRNLLSKEISKDIFEENKKLYDDIKENEKSILNKIKEHKDIVKKAKVFLDNFALELKNLSGTNETKEQYVKKHKKEINEYIKTKEESENAIKNLNAELSNEKDTEGLIDPYIKKIKTFEDYKQYIKTSDYWADTWAISTFEWLLNVKFIILNSSKYPESIHEIMECGEKNKNIGNTFRPTHYIITTYNGNHYELVSYKNKGIFEFKELPYDIRILITNKCIEKNAGIFNNIDEFRDFQKRIGLDPSKNGDLEIKENYDGLYDNTIVFMFYSKSSGLAKPGKGTGEKIPLDKIKLFIPLSKNKDWRRKLDDSWMDEENPFIVDNKKWASVSHYLWGVAFKNKFPENYILFSLQSGNKISKSYDLAKKNISKPDLIEKYDEFLLSKDYIVHRENALRAKFSKNELKELLLNTKNACLLHFENKNPPKEDKLLMFIRNEFLKL